MCVEETLHYPLSTLYSSARTSCDNKNLQSVIYLLSKLSIGSKVTISFTVDCGSFTPPHCIHPP